MIKNLNEEINVNYEFDLLDERLCDELEEKIEMACWINICSCDVAI